MSRVAPTPLDASYSSFSLVETVKEETLRNHCYQGSMDDAAVELTRLVGGIVRLLTQIQEKMAMEQQQLADERAELDRRRASAQAAEAAAMTTFKSMVAGEALSPGGTSPPRALALLLGDSVHSVVQTPPKASGSQTSEQGSPSPVPPTTPPAGVAAEGEAHVARAAAQEDAAASTAAAESTLVTLPGEVMRTPTSAAVPSAAPHAHNGHSRAEEVVAIPSAQAKEHKVNGSTVNYQRVPLQLIRACSIQERQNAGSPSCEVAATAKPPASEVMRAASPPQKSGNSMSPTSHPGERRVPFELVKRCSSQPLGRSTTPMRGKAGSPPPATVARSQLAMTPSIESVSGSPSPTPAPAAAAALTAPAPAGATDATDTAGGIATGSWVLASASSTSVVPNSAERAGASAAGAGRGPYPAMT